MAKVEVVTGGESSCEQSYRSLLTYVQGTCLHSHSTKFCAE